MQNGTNELTEVEKLRMENFALKHNMLQSQIQMVIAERVNFIESINENHPGYVWDEQKGLVPAVPKKVEV